MPDPNIGPHGFIKDVHSLLIKNAVAYSFCT